VSLGAPLKIELVGVVIGFSCSYESPDPLEEEALPPPFACLTTGGDSSNLNGFLHSFVSTRSLPCFRAISAFFWSEPTPFFNFEDLDDVAMCWAKLRTFIRGYQSEPLGFFSPACLREISPLVGYLSFRVIGKGSSGSISLRSSPYFAFKIRFIFSNFPHFAPPQGFLDLHRLRNGPPFPTESVFVVMNHPLKPFFVLSPLAPQNLSVTSAPPPLSNHLPSHPTLWKPMTSPPLRSSFLDLPRFSLWKRLSEGNDIVDFSLFEISVGGEQP